MPARRADTHPPLRLVREEDCTPESMWEATLRLGVDLPPAPRVAVFDLGEHAVVERARPAREVRTLRGWCKRKLAVPPSQLPFALDRPRALARVKGYSLGTGKLTNKEKEDSGRLRPYMLKQVDIPRTRAECVDGPRPCIVARCRHNLYITVNPSGSIKLNFPDKLPEELEYTCALDAADEHHETGMTLERVGELNGLSLERVRQVEASGLQKLKARLNPDALRALFASRRE